MKVENCTTCKHTDLFPEEGACRECENWSNWADPNGSIEFKRLNGLTPTEGSCTFKLLEEVGELMQVIGKVQGKKEDGSRLKTGENNPIRIIEEALDVAQSATTMAFVLAEKYGIEINTYVKLHEEKLRERGYMK